MLLPVLLHLALGDAVSTMSPGGLEGSGSARSLPDTPLLLMVVGPTEVVPDSASVQDCAQGKQEMSKPSTHSCHICPFYRVVSQAVSQSVSKASQSVKQSVR